MQNEQLSLEWKQLADLPDVEGFAGSYAGVSNGALLVCGGANFPEKPLWEGGILPSIAGQTAFMYCPPAMDGRMPPRCPSPWAMGLLPLCRRESC